MISLIYRLRSDFLQGKNLNFGGNAAGFKVKGGFFNRKQWDRIPSPLNFLDSSKTYIHASADDMVEKSRFLSILRNVIRVSGDLSKTNSWYIVWLNSRETRGTKLYNDKKRHASLATRRWNKSSFTNYLRSAISFWVKLSKWILSNELQINTDHENSQILRAFVTHSSISL